MPKRRVVSPVVVPAALLAESQEKLAQVAELVAGPGASFADFEAVSLAAGDEARRMFREDLVARFSRGPTGEAAAPRRRKGC